MKPKEQHIYGSSRLGMKNCDREMIGAQAVSDVGTFALVRGEKSYELSNHLGNVLEVITDQKFAISDVGSGIDHFLAEVISYTDYEPFGAPMDNGSASTDRNWQGEYRYGFNGHEKSKEISANGNHTTALFWEFDTRTARRWNIDPKPNPSISYYSVLSNSPIHFQDPFGDTIIVNSNTKKSDGNEYVMFKLDDGKEDVISQAYDQFKDTGVQWYAKNDENYAKIVYINPNLVNDGKAIGITSEEFGREIDRIRTDLHKSASYKTFGWGITSIYNNFNHGEQGDIKAKGKLLDGYKLTIYTGFSGSQQLIRSDLLGNFIFGLLAQEHGQNFSDSKKQGDYLQSGLTDDVMDTYFILLGHERRMWTNSIPDSFNKNAKIED